MAELHRTGRAGWLRAAVLGSDDAIVSTSSLMIGVAASHPPAGAILIAGVAGLVAGAMSMAVGEYVSVSSQRDAEQADVARETRELADQPRAELKELALIYVKRGLDKELAMRVAEQLSARDRLGAHLRDELGIDQATLAQPMQAAWISAASFASFALIANPCAACRAVGLGHSGDCRVFSRQPRGAGSARRTSGWRADRPRCTARDGRRWRGDGGDRRHRPDLRRRGGLKALHPFPSRGASLTLRFTTSIHTRAPMPATTTTTASSACGRDM